MATGGGLSTRELYSDGDEVIFETERPVIVTAIEEVITRPDLLDRALLVPLPAIAEARRRAEAAFWTEFETAAPQLLGGLLDVVATTIERFPTVTLDALPRMADFALWSTAAEVPLGLSPRTFLAIYTKNRASAHETAIEASPIGPALRALAEAGGWTGTASDLLETGADLRWVQEQMGHASVQQTADTYGHLLPDRHHMAAGALDQFLGGISETEGGPDRATVRNPRATGDPPAR